MAKSHADHIVVIGAGASGLMTARELARAGKRVTILEGRDRCGGRIDPLPVSEFGYPAEGGAEYIHGEAPVTRALLREAGIATLPIAGDRWVAQDGAFSQEEIRDYQNPELHRILHQLTDDLTVTEFLVKHFAGPEHDRLRYAIERMVEGYDAADPAKASILALREEWLDGDRGTQSRVAGGYGAMIQFLIGECRKHGAALRLGAKVVAIETNNSKAVVRCADGNQHACGAVVVTVPLPLLAEIEFPPADRGRIAATAQIGFGNVIKLVLRFRNRWWQEQRSDLADMLFLLSDEAIPVWWTQLADERPVLTGWFAGPRTQSMSGLDEAQLIKTGVASLAKLFQLQSAQLEQGLVAARAINWSKDPFARGAYSYATTQTRQALPVIDDLGDSPIRFAGEAFYRGKDIGTVEAALANGLATARAILMG